MEMQSYKMCQLSCVCTKRNTVIKIILKIPVQDRLAQSLAELWLTSVSQESRSQFSTAQEKPFFLFLLNVGVYIST